MLPYYLPLTGGQWAGFKKYCIRDAQLTYIVQEGAAIDMHEFFIFDAYFTSEQECQACDASSMT